MRKRVYSLIFCLLFILTALPMIASADTIDKVSVAGVEAPLPGQTPTYYARTRTQGYEVYEYNSVNYRNGVCWYDETNKKEMATADTFAEGGIYTVKVYLYALEGNSFKVNGRDSAVTALYNDKEAKIVNATPKGTRDPESILLLTYTFAPAKAAKVKDVAFSVTAPAAGRKPVFAGSTTDPECRVNTAFEGDKAIKGVEWYDETDKVSLTADSVFLGEHSYMVTLHVIANPGYEFTVDAQVGTPDVTATLNGEEATVIGTRDADLSKREITLIYSFEPCPVVTIDTLSVTDLAEPRGGEAPAYGFTIAGEGYYSEVEDSDIVWYNDSTRQPMAAGEKFVTGTQYTVEIALYAHAGYKMGQQLVGSVNGQSAFVTRGNDEKAVLRRSFIAGESRIITAVNVFILGEPVLGDVPQYGAVIAPDAPYEIDTSLDDGVTVINGVQWIGNVGTAMRYDETFVGGVYYRAIVFLKAKEGYSFAVDAAYRFIVAATVNGDPADDLNGDSLSNSLGVVKDFAPMQPTYINEAAVHLLPPAADQMPDYEPWSGTKGVEIRTFPVPHGLKGVQWYDLTDEAWMEPTDSFRNAHVYRVFITVQAASGYRFVNDGDRPLLIGSVNDLPCGVDAALDPDFIAVLVRDFTVGAWGDVDGDGKVTSTDARLTLQYSVEKIGAADLNLSVADVDGDGRVNSTDARLILQKAVNKLTYFPVEAKG